ncbi:hypothetical protein MUCCIDRAFT_165291 [Mucor lusitanicus CBS 277.49]|uniref:Uncharacterized protein n=2 Tax=Mucor circinelloides f. lusitanicus TaxID=29924 RepID=A0A168JNC5_MUCCL|nr:hypothetical protein MUCCIDRAFT_165291 [Mucor lusitanicus CBS 277.49]
MNPLQEQSAQTGIHPSTTNDLDQSSGMNAQSRDGGVWMKKPEAMAATTGLGDLNQQQRDANSAISSTPSEYGSDDTSHRSPHANQSSSERPVADRDAFIQADQNQWQNKMSPAERAKQLAAEMDQKIDRRRTSTGSIGDKILKIGGKKEYKLD